MIEPIKRAKPVTFVTPWLVAVLLALGLSGCSDEQQSMPSSAAKQTQSESAKTLSYEDAKKALEGMITELKDL